MPYKYLYIDDEGKDTSEALASGLSSDKVNVEYKHISIFTPDFIKKNLDNYNGIVLDLRLDDTPNSSDFTATEFAQHIRTLVTKKELKKDLPIILFSTDDKLKQVYATDLSSHNLFDTYYRKTNTSKNASKELFSLAQGYMDIAKNKNDIAKLMGLEDLYDLDGEIFARFSNENQDIPEHEYAQVILKDLIYATGTLIDEDILASRLGIDIDIENSKNWNDVKQIFETAKYKGVFSDGWDRWWMFEINNIFQKEFQTNLSYLNAEEKCKLFTDKGIKNILAPKPIEFNNSNRYTTICQVLKKPLDSLEGYRIYTSKPLKQWQEYSYASLFAFAEKLNEEKGIIVHPEDRDSLNDALSEL